MPPGIKLFEVVGMPGRIAISRVDPVIAAGNFFLDFTRPLYVQRWFGFGQHSIGRLRALYVPVIHQNEPVGARIVHVARRDPFFNDLRDLWAAYHGGPAYPPILPPDAGQIEQDFRRHFPSLR